MGDDGRQTWCVDWRSAEEGDEMAPTLRGGGRDVPIVAAQEESVTTDPAEPTAGATTKAGRSLATLESVPFCANVSGRGDAVAGDDGVGPRVMLSSAREEKRWEAEAQGNTAKRERASPGPRSTASFRSNAHAIC